VDLGAAERSTDGVAGVSSLKLIRSLASMVNASPIVAHGAGWFEAPPLPAPAPPLQCVVYQVERRRLRCAWASPDRA
jgi:hypothetical protein